MSDLIKSKRKGTNDELPMTRSGRRRSLAQLKLSGERKGSDISQVQRRISRTTDATEETVFGSRKTSKISSKASDDQPFGTRTTSITVERKDKKRSTSQSDSNFRINSRKSSQQLRRGSRERTSSRESSAGPSKRLSGFSQKGSGPSVDIKESLFGPRKLTKETALKKTTSTGDNSGQRKSSDSSSVGLKKKSFSDITSLPTSKKTDPGIGDAKQLRKDSVTSGKRMTSPKRRTRSMSSDAPLSRSRKDSNMKSKSERPRDSLDSQTGIRSRNRSTEKTSTTSPVLSDQHYDIQQETDGIRLENSTGGGSSEENDFELTMDRLTDKITSDLIRPKASPVWKPSSNPVPDIASVALSSSGSTRSSDVTFRSRNSSAFVSIPQRQTTHEVTVLDAAAAHREIVTKYTDIKRREEIAFLQVEEEVSRDSILSQEWQASSSQVLPSAIFDSISRGRSRVADDKYLSPKRSRTRSAANTRHPKPVSPRYHQQAYPMVGHTDLWINNNLVHVG